MTINAVPITRIVGTGGILKRVGPVPDFWVDKARPDNTGDGLTRATAKRNITNAMALVTPGASERIRIVSGIYDEAADKIEEVDLTIGSASGYHILEAENPGGVKIRQSLGDINATAGTSAYWEFHGLDWEIPDNENRAALRRQYIKYFDCSFQGGQYKENHTVASAGDSYQLFEGCLFYGHGARSVFAAFEKTHITLRDCIFRLDTAWGWIGGQNNPISVFTIYPQNIPNSIHAYVQNCLFMDATHFDPPAISGQGYGGVNANTHNPADPGTGTDQTDIYFWNNVFVNMKSAALQYTGSAPSSRPFGYQEAENNVFLGGDSGLNYNVEMRGSPKSKNKYNLFYGQSNFGLGNNKVGAANTVESHQNIFENIGTTAVSGVGIVEGDYNAAWGGDTSGIGTNPILGDKSAQVLYPFDFESGASLATGGPGGDRVGPSLLKRRGKSGTLPGDPGHNDITNVDMWPFRNEERWRNDMRQIRPCTAITLDGTYVPFDNADIGKKLQADAVDVGEILGFDNTAQRVLVKLDADTFTPVADNAAITVVGGTGAGDAAGASVQASPEGKRGACADGLSLGGQPLTLTRYLWEYKGNQIRAGIY